MSRDIWQSNLNTIEHLGHLIIIIDSYQITTIGFMSILYTYHLRMPLQQNRLKIRIQLVEFVYNNEH